MRGARGYRLSLKALRKMETLLGVICPFGSHGIH
jgi:hypothetical protein